MIKLSLILSLMFLNACAGDESEAKREEKESKQEEKAIKTQEKAQFKSLAECVKSKSGGAKPTAEILKQCLSSSS